MSEHLSEETIMRIADGEEEESAHIRDCVQCANALLEAMQLKRAVREVMGGGAARFSAPAHAPKRAARYLAIAASLAVVALLGFTMHNSRREAARELVDLHTTIVGSTNPIEVVSTDKHTVKPWFEGRVPFNVDVPDLTGTPFQLVGGRVAFWNGHPVAYLLLTKGSHRVSLFVIDEEKAPQIGTAGPLTIESWRKNGLLYVSVSDLPREEIRTLK
jgi:anti-sigma factor RsiW